jgi:hypothetical protein
MGGSDELEPIAFYNATGRLFSDREAVVAAHAPAW